jgi:UTP--glucose-1-phosphate uridylyltransferase
MSCPRPRTAILPVAGLGTRLLPATKAVPKELLPVFDTPLLQFAIDEAVAAGVERLVLVSHPDKRGLRRYLEDDADLAVALRRSGKAALAEALERTGVQSGIDVRFTWQERPLGLGHAVLCAVGEVLDGPVAVLLPDDLIVPGCLADMVEAYDPDRAGVMVAAAEVRRIEIGRYGAFRVTGQQGSRLAASGLVEKPDPRTAPSCFAAVGRYILPPEIFGVLSVTSPGSGGEVQLTDAIDALVASQGLEGYLYDGHRFDCGAPEGLLAASNWRRAACLAEKAEGARAAAGQARPARAARSLSRPSTALRPEIAAPGPQRRTRDQLGIRPDSGG